MRTGFGIRANLGVLTQEKMTARLRDSQLFGHDVRIAKSDREGSFRVKSDAETSSDGKTID